MSMQTFHTDRQLSTHLNQIFSFHYINNRWITQGAKFFNTAA